MFCYKTFFVDIVILDVVISMSRPGTHAPATGDMTQQKKINIKLLQNLGNWSVKSVN